MILPPPTRHGRLNGCVGDTNLTEKLGCLGGGSYERDLVPFLQTEITARNDHIGTSLHSTDQDAACTDEGPPS